MRMSYPPSANYVCLRVRNVSDSNMERSSDIYVASTLTVTNHLPVDLDFEIADGLAAADGATVIGGGFGVPVGKDVDVLTCDVERAMPTIRVKIAGLAGWSGWYELAVEEEEVVKKGGEKAGQNEDISRCKTGFCQGDDGSGTPVTFGVR